MSFSSVNSVKPLDDLANFLKEFTIIEKTLASEVRLRVLYENKKKTLGYLVNMLDYLATVLLVFIIHINLYSKFYLLL